MLSRGQLKQTEVAFGFDSVEAVRHLILSRVRGDEGLQLDADGRLLHGTVQFNTVNRTHAFTLMCSPNYTKMIAKKLKQ